MKLWNRVCSLLLAAALLFGLLPTVRPTVVEAAAPSGVHNNLPSTAKDIVYLSDMAWEYSTNYQSKVAVRDCAWNSTSKIVLGRNTSSDTSFNNTTFQKGLGVMAKGTDATTANASYTVFDLADNNYELSSFYAAAGLTNPSALSSDYGVVFEVWGSYDRSGTAYGSAEYVLLESSGDPDYGTHVTQDYVYQFHVDVTGVRYLKLVVYAVGGISGMNAAWGGACVYNNPGYYPKSELLHDTNGSNQSWTAPENATPFQTYHFNDIPADATYLSGTTYKNSSNGAKTDKVVEFTSASGNLGYTANGYWFGGTTETFIGVDAASGYASEGIQVLDATKYLRYNCKSATVAGSVIFDVSGLNANRFYTAFGSGNGATAHKKLDADGNRYYGLICEVWGAATKDGTYTKLAESEPIMLSHVGEFIVDITGVNYLKLVTKTKGDCLINGMDAMFFSPCVYKAPHVEVDGTHSVLRGLSANYTATVTGGDGTETVTWAVSGNSSASTTIDATTGVLTVASDETAAYLDVTASVTVDEVPTTSESFPVVVRRTPQNMYNQLPKTAKDIKYLSDMTYKFSSNRDNMATKKDVAVDGSTIVLGDLEDNGGTRFAKGLAVKPDNTANSSHTAAMQTVFDLADNNYAQSYFYAAAGIVNNNAKNSTNTGATGNGVYFAVYGSYDKTAATYDAAEYVLLETSDKITKGAVHQFHLDVTGVRYLKLVVYGAQTSISFMDCAWAGACVYNNPGYYPKTDMIGDCTANGVYVPYADRDETFVAANPTMFNLVENMFNTYQFQKLPADAKNLATMAREQTITPGVNVTADCWLGGANATDNGYGEKDGIVLPGGSSPFFRNNSVSNGVTEGYIVYDVSSLDVDTFYAIVGVREGGFKTASYNRSTGSYGGVGFEVWGDKGDGKGYTLLSASEVIHKSNTGEFIVDITGVKLLKLRHYHQDPRSESVHGVFGYASVFKALDVSVSGATSVEPGTSQKYTATARHNFTDYTGSITWTLSGGEKAGTKLENGVLTVDPLETATSLTVTASVTADGETVSDSVTVTVAGNATGLRNHRPKTAKDIKYLSDMTVVDSLNNLNSSKNNYDTILDGAWTAGNIKLGLADTDGGTTFYKGLGVMPNGKTLDGASYTVFDLAESGYAHDFFYSAAGITNGNAAANVPNNGVVFAVYGSYDKSVENYENAEFVLLESSGTVTPNQVYQFHVDVTGVRYLKLVVYAPSGIGFLNSAWGGACLYNNDGYYPKTDMIGDCDQNSGAYIAYPDRVPSKTPNMFNAAENMFNTYQFENLPAGATLLRSEKVSSYKYPGLGGDAIWLGGGHVAVNGQGWQSPYDGIQLPAGSTPYFKDDPDANEGYVVYDVSGLNANTFYAIIGATDTAFKYQNYDPATGNYGGIVFEVLGDYGDGEFKLLSASEVITKSNTGEFIVDITGVKLLKLRHYQQDPNAAQVHGAFGYASVFSQWSVSVSGSTSVEKGTTENYTATVCNGFADGKADITWTVTGGGNGTTIDENGVLTVAADETATELTVTASATVDGKEITDSVTVTVTEAAVGVLNHRPKTATDIKHLSNMTWEYSINNGGKEAVKDRHWAANKAIVLGDLAENGGTTFTKGLGVQPDKSADPSQETAMQTVFDLADNGYKQSFFYAAAGITNDYAKNSLTEKPTTNGVYFAVYGSYDKNEEDYENAEYVLLETSDKITNGRVHQFHLDITGVRYLKLVVYTAQNSIGYMDCNWAGACVYNNPGYYPKTDMIGSCNEDEGAYVAPADPSMFNTYHFPNLPDGTVTLATQTRVEEVVHVKDDGSSSLGVNAGWMGGTHLSVTDKAGTTQSEKWIKDGIRFPANSSVYFNIPMTDETVGATDGYVVYDVSGLNGDTFYCIVGSVNDTYKYSNYDATTGDFGGMVFEVWGADTQDGAYTLLSASEPILKSNTGEFLVDITDVNFLKLQIRAQDSRTNGYATGAFAYASVFNDESWGVTASGKTSVVKGATAEVSANVTRDFVGDYYYYGGDIAWAVTGGVAGTKVKDGVLTVASDETAASLQVTASITEGGKTLTSNAVTLAVVDKIAYVGDTGYDTLADAINNANGETVVLKGDAGLTKALKLNSQVTLDLGGNTVSGAENILLGADAKLTVVSGGGKLDGKLKLAASGAEITSDCAIALEMNGYEATVNGCDVILTDSATNGGTVGGKIYGDCTVNNRLTKNGVIHYVVLDSADGTYKTANAVRVKLTKVSIRPSEAGMYYTTELKFNQNVANAGANYGVVLSTQNKPGTDFMTELKGDSKVNLWTRGIPNPNADFQKTGNSCLVKNILSSSANDSDNATRGATEIFANSYVKLTVDGQEIVVMAENNGTVKHSLQSVMTAFDEKLATELQTFAQSKDEADLTKNGKNLYDFYEAWEGGMRSWSLPNLVAAYNRDYLKSHQVILTDILNGRIIVTDLDAEDPLNAENLTWEWAPTAENGWTLTRQDDIKETEDSGGSLSEAVLRNHTKYGNVVLFCSSRNTVGMIEYPSGKCLWEATVSHSPHGIELLPDGDIVVSSSGGGTTTNGTLYYYNWTGSTYSLSSTVSLQGAHSITWDPSNNVLWAMAELGLTKCTVNTTSNTLAKGETVWTTENYGHDVTPDYSDSDILWLTDNNGVYQYSKSQNKIIETGKPTMGGVKGVAAFSDGLVSFASYSDCAEGVSNPATVRVYRPKRNGTFVLEKYTDEASGWNKVRVFTADYQ